MSFALELKALSDKFRNRVYAEVGALEKKLSDALALELKVLCKEHGYACPSEWSFYGGMESTAKLFINNHLIDNAIANDPSGAWKGVPRMENLADHIDSDDDDD